MFVSTKIQFVRASGTIYIKADGSIDPPTAPIQRDGDSYRVTGNITSDADGIVIDRDNMTLDGNWCVIQGTVAQPTVGIRIWENHNVTIINARTESFDVGVSIFDSGDVNLTRNTLSHARFGIVIVSSSNYTVSANTVVANTIDNIQVVDSTYGSFLANNISDTHFGSGIRLENSAHNMAVGNTIEDAYYGLLVYSASEVNTLSANNITGCEQGIVLWDSRNSTLTNNIMKESGLIVYGSTLDHYIHSIDVTNTIDSKPVYYLVSEANRIIDSLTTPDVGYLGLVNCTGITVEKQNVVRGGQGLLLAYTNDSRVEGNTMSNNTNGIVLCHSSRNTFVTNNIANSSMSGVWFDGSMNQLNSIVECNISGNGYCGIRGQTDSGIITACNITLNGDYGVCLGFGGTNNTLLGNNISDNDGGVLLQHSSNNTIVENCINANKWVGAYFDHAANNTLLRNSITANGRGFYLQDSSENSICLNNIDNINQVYVASSISFWNSSYPLGGNYWSDYSGVDLKSGPYQNQTGSDGVGDTPYVIDPYNQDNYPLMALISTYDAGVWHGETCNIIVLSNSTISDFQLHQEQGMISFNVAGDESTSGFCRITIPNTIVNDLWQGNCMVLLSGEPHSYTNWTDTISTCIYVNYTHPEQQIVIIPELPSALILPLLVALSAAALAFAEKKHPKDTQA
jgi:parallel beta-helix repeat protein